MWVNNTKKFRAPDPTSKSALGCRPIHLSLVTRGESEREGEQWSALID